MLLNINLFFDKNKVKSTENLLPAKDEEKIDKFISELDRAIKQKSKGRDKVFRDTLSVDTQLKKNIEEHKIEDKNIKEKNEEEKELDEI